jgi:hypothetical protein
MGIPQTDQWTHNNPDGFGGLESPATDWVNVTPDDNNDLPFIPRAVSFATTGVIATIPSNQTGTPTAIPTALAGGVQHAMRPRRIMSTGTGAIGTITIWK